VKLHHNEVMGFMKLCAIYYNFSALKFENDSYRHIIHANLTKYKKGTHYMGSKIFNHLPNHIKGLLNEKRVFKKTLQRFLFDNVFYSIDEFLKFQCQ
jgi:hypothetical protein